MNVVRIMGGLGNQLYQYAFGKVMEMHGQEVCYDVSWYDRNAQITDRPYLLDYFVQDVKKGKLLRQFTYHEISYDAHIFTLRNRNFHGYWQYLDYYRKYVDLFQSKIQLLPCHYSNEYLQLLTKIKNTISIGIHVRRGDYLGSSFQVLPFAYYAEAIKYFYNIATEPIEFFLFSDDVVWCKEHFKNVTIVELYNTPLEFDLLRQCKHQIISSSTFSWWAAWLNNNVHKLVICPEQFIVRKQDAHKYNNNIHYPKEWIKLFNYVNN